MSKYNIIFVTEAVLIFLLIFLSLYLILKETKDKKTTVKKRSIYSKFKPKTIVAIIFASIGCAVALYLITNEVVASFGVALPLFIALVPYVVIGQADRQEKEAIFDDVIYFCQTMALLLKQTHDVYNSLIKVQKDMNTVFKDDIVTLIRAFESGQNTVLEAMKQIEENYNYSCIKNLNIIMTHMNYEKADIDEALIIAYQDDLEALERDVRDNNSIRKSERLVYIGITALAIFGFYYFINSLKPSFGPAFDTPLYKIVNLVFLIACLLTLFAVDNYYNKNTTKE